MVDLLPKDRKSHEENDDDSVIPTDWLEQMGELYPWLDSSLKKESTCILQLVTLESSLKVSILE
jgi:hypothetical protein